MSTLGQIVIANIDMMKSGEVKVEVGSVTIPK